MTICKLVDIYALIRSRTIQWS